MTNESGHVQTVATWQVRRTRLPVVRRRCPVCGGDSFGASGKFRINANRKLLDVWLLLRCARCNRTAKVTVIERSASIDSSLLRRFEDNDPDLVIELLLDPVIARQNHLSLDWTDSWEVIADPVVPGCQFPYSVHITFADPVPLRPSELIARGLGISRSRVKKMVDAGLMVLPIKPGTETCAAFDFIVMGDA